ncbi:tyrosine-type recombinase/integrase [Mycobacteroides chelonae]|jgi:integrase|uniref:Site-specific integrase n=1 Tax=Mycobacteroides chelonae TaxID=1774 RepID=A0A1S1LW76_MYCCH|nr:site-specific integrase [Mycobacteroides chelonae]MBF9315819.1 site-specific integrase [Mycobacteroides chelonae]OHT68266.1 site-specific integrase [Mycobacteroides chelonae]OHT75724.1 site-specific integrase [Mycobacteroides chelonae]OHT87330.1 site-specific integrase [Mycobacteroides chelonae]OHU77044.1 site-specific integrase [Mycobacteroides chelonae]
MANANGEGSIYKRIRSGRQTGYVGAVSYIDEAGAHKRHTVYGKTRAEVRAKMDGVRERLAIGATVKDSKRTLGDWLAHWRGTTLAASDRKESTKELYANISRRHLEVEPFGAIRLDKLKPSDIEGLVLALRAKTKQGRVTEANAEPEPVRALSDATIRQAYTVLRAGLDGAVRDGLLAKNPAAAVQRPGLTRREAKHVDAVDVNKLLLCAEGLRYRDVLALIAGTGLRRGEALALRWADVDLDKRMLAVRGTLGRVGGRLIITEPKTERSRRTVPLSLALVAMLRAHRAAQDAERQAAGNQWNDHQLAFTTEIGTPVDPRNILRTVQIAARKAGIADVGVHTLRHSAAVAWLEGQVHIKAVADLLGHSSIAITGDIYGHTSDNTARTAIDALTDQLGIQDL